ncbi:MAG TPA: hypothetical protein VGD07_04775 [Methylomirabilota bacterium]
MRGGGRDETGAAAVSDDRAVRTRVHWLDTLARYKRDPDGPGSAEYWSPSLDCASRDELRAIQDAKLAALRPFFYENSTFYRRRFDRLGVLPTDLRTVDDLPKWPVVDKAEMMADVQAAPPFGTYTRHDDALWAARGWMMFSSSGSTGMPRVFREGTRGLTVCTSLNSESSPPLRFLVGDYATFTSARCECGRTHLRAVGAFAGRADELINLRGVKMYPVQLEAAVRAVPGVGDEYEIVLATTAGGLDVLTARVEHADGSIAARVAREIQARCEVRCDVEVLAPGTLPKTEFKARRVRDMRRASGA